MAISDIVGQMADQAIKTIAAHEPSRTYYYDTQADPTATSWVELSGNIVFHSTGEAFEYDEDVHADVESLTATLETATDVTALDISHYVKVDSTVWKVMSGPRGSGAYIYDLARVIPDNYGPDHGDKA